MVQKIASLFIIQMHVLTQDTFLYGIKKLSLITFLKIR